MYGKVATFKSEKGYGFLRRADGEDDIFFHVSDFDQGIEPSTGQTVEFTIGQRRGRPIARDIRLIGMEADAARTVLGGQGAA
jgi:cold shock CspA family protein